MIGIFWLVGRVALASNAWANETEVFRIYRRDIPFTLITDSGITITSNCVSGGKLKSCQAAAALKKVNVAKMDIDLFGHNPGEMMCSRQAGGTVVWSRDPQGNERTFCQFKDGSLVSSGTLTRFGNRNAKR